MINLITNKLWSEMDLHMVVPIRLIRKEAGLMVRDGSQWWHGTAHGRAHRTVIRFAAI